jgi:hypothetical protein
MLLIRYATAFVTFIYVLFMLLFMWCEWQIKLDTLINMHYTHHSVDD